MRFRRLLLTLFALAGSAAAQFTVVTGTVTDPNGIAYANGTIVSTLVSSASPTLSGLPYSPPSGPTQLDGSGKFTIRLGDNSVLSPGGTQWTFLICSGSGTIQPAGGKGPVCFTVPALTISGSSQSITSNITAVPPPALSINPGTGTLTSVSCTAPLACTPSPIVSTGSVACLTCVTSTGGGALTASAPITVNAAGNIACATCNTSAASLTAHAPVVGAGGQAENTIASTGNSGAALLSQGASTDPAYGALNLAGGSNIVTGVLPPANGATGNITTSGQGYCILPFCIASVLNQAGSTSNGGANAMNAELIVLPWAITFTKATVFVTATSNTNHWVECIYTPDGGTLLRQISWTLTASTGALSSTVSSTTLAAGPYWLSWGSDSGTPTVLASISNQTNASTLFNTNTTQSGAGATALSSSNCGTTVGVGSLVAATNVQPPMTKLEP